MNTQGLLLLKGDTVRYVGNSKIENDDGSAVNLVGKVGVVDTHVRNTDELIVDFGGHFVICQPGNLARQSHGASNDDYHSKQIERRWRTSENKGGKAER